MKKSKEDVKHVCLKAKDKAKLIRKATSMACKDQIDMINRNGGMKVLDSFIR